MEKLHELKEKLWAELEELAEKKHSDQPMRCSSP